ncbi:GNAT family N-acetyltransferase [Acinetobacter lwoffii]|uniref:GNAT family N-acetyltransferase n=1 Tax=Acinetobacter lwoffii TaxID=28090 RepID=UPI00209B6FA3|nr:GNAT family N-acetyltransferase [Acinetobacter lwoffii]MCO8072545.1 GNAT family N-acetyltransferase [Acinetobacter lwoffii]MCO8075523.1 GNAT family N-acetyltransferase [Acinetobacter lwoffii]
MIRLATQQDVLPIAQVHVQSWHESYQNIIKPEILDKLSVEQRAALWRSVLEQKNRRVFVYEENAQVLGFAAFNFPVDAPISELRALYLLQKIQGRGIGCDLVQLGSGFKSRKILPAYAMQRIEPEFQSLFL